MRIEPEHGQDIPVEARSVVIQQGDKKYRITDRGDHLEVMALGFDALIVRPQAANVIVLRQGTP